MKQILILLFFVLLIGKSNAQTMVNPYPRTITVTGTAELEIVPDEIYVVVDLREYEHKGQGKVGIEKIKNDFLKNARSTGIPDSAISIAAYDSFHSNPWLRKKNKRNEMYASIAYQVKLKSSTQLDDLVDKLDDLATQNFYIQRTAHSKLADYRRSLKIEAVKAAKEKAGYLTEAASEKIGEAVTIHEPVEYYLPFYNNNRSSNMMMKAEAQEISTGADAPVVDFRKIKLKYDVTVVFALK